MYIPEVDNENTKKQMRIFNILIVVFIILVIGVGFFL